jgi:hypothetical protein
MKKKLKKIGNSIGIIFNREECEANNFEVGDFIDIDDAVLIKNKKRKHAK